MASIYPRKDSKVLWMVYRDRSGKRIRESTFTEDWQEAQREPAGTASGQGRQYPRYRPERRATTILGLGGFFPGELLQATDPRRKDPRSE